MDNSKKILILAHFLERYDIGLFIFYSPLLIVIFFPQDYSHGIIYSTLLFSSAYLARPVGSVFFGFIGDKLGRKISFLVSIYLMMVATLIIAILPTFYKIGYIASISVFICRILQGIASGGEFTSVVLLISEDADKKFLPKNLIFMRIAGLSGLIFAGLISLAVNIILPDLWRISFIIGFFLTIVNLYLRKSISESKQFSKEQKDNNLLKFPLTEILKNYKMNLFYSFAIGALGPAVFYTSTVFLPEQVVFKIDQTFLKIIILLTWLIFTYCQYFAIKFIHPIKLLMISCIAILLISILFIFINHNNIILILFVMLSFTGATFFSLSPCLYKVLFKTNMRHSGISLGISMGQGVFGGTAPVILAFIYENLDNVLVY